MGGEGNVLKGRRMRLVIVVIVSIVRGDRGGGIVSEGRAGIDSTNRRPIGGCTSGESVHVGDSGFERGNGSEFSVAGWAGEGGNG
jgi:hypothetical protein